MAFDPKSLDGIKKSSDKLGKAEGGIGANPLTKNSDLSGQEGAKPAKSGAGDDDGFYNRMKNKSKDGAKDKSPGSGLKEDAKTAVEAGKLAASVADGNWADAARNAWKNREAYYKTSKKAVFLTVGGLVAIMLVGMIVFSMLFTAVGSAINGVQEAVEKATGIYYAKAAASTASRIVEVAIDKNPFSGTQPPKTKLGQELASLDVNDSMQQLANTGTQKSKNSDTSNRILASTSLTSKLANFADVSSGIKNVKPDEAAKNLNSTIKYSGNKVTINGATVTIPPAGASSAELTAYYKKMNYIMKTSDPFKIQSAAPQMASFNSKIRKQYNIPSEAWENEGKGYDGLSNEDAFKKTQQDTHKGVIGGSLSARTSTLPFVQKLQDEIKTNLSTAVSDGKTDPIQAAENDALNKFIIDNVFTPNDINVDVLAGYSMCLVNDMDIGAPESTSTMVPTSIRQAAAFAAAADQTVSGDLQGNELGANLDLYGDMYNQGNYQQAIFNSGWNNAGAFQQLPQSSYQQFLNQTPPAGMYSELKDVVTKGLNKRYTLDYIGIDSYPTKDFITDPERPCGSTDDIATSVNPSVGYSGIFSFLNFFSNEKKLNQIKGFVAEVEDTMNQYITGGNATGLTALSQIPGSVFSNSVKLGFSYLLKSTISNNLGINYAGVQNNNYTNQVVSGYSLLGGEQARKMTYGRPLTLGEVSQIKAEQLADHKNDMSNRSVFARITDANDPYSLASQMAVASTGWRNNMLGQATASIGRSFSFISQPSSLLASAGQIAFNNSGVTGDNIAYAADDPSTFISSQFPDPNGGNIQWGWSQAEMDKIQSDASYGLLKNAAIVEGWQSDSNNSQSKYIAKIAPCFEGDVSKIVSDKGLRKICVELSGNDTALRYRLYKSDETMISDLKDLQTITQDGSSSSESTSTAGATIDEAHIYDDSSGVACAPNTQDVGVRDGYRANNLVNIKLCAIPNLTSTASESTPGTSYYIEGADGKLVVNSRVSGAVYAMGEAAKAAGVDMRASSGFRSMAHQTYLYEHPQAITAKPGTSNHQMGLAIDFGAGPNALPGSPGPIPGNPLWVWLAAHAKDYGYKNLPSEAWHWSTAGN